MTEFHRALGRLVWDYVGMARNRAGLERAITQIQDLREEFWQNLKVPGEASTYNKNLEFARAGWRTLWNWRELMAPPTPLQRGRILRGPLREEYQTPDGEAQAG